MNKYLSTKVAFERDIYFRIKDLAEKEDKSFAGYIRELVNEALKARLAGDAPKADEAVMLRIDKQTNRLAKMIERTAEISGKAATYSYGAWALGSKDKSTEELQEIAQKIAQILEVRENAISTRVYKYLRGEAKEKGPTTDASNT